MFTSSMKGCAVRASLGTLALVACVSVAEAQTTLPKTELSGTSTNGSDIRGFGYGRAVSIVGDRAVVTAPDLGNGPTSVFERVNGQWVLVQTFTDPDFDPERGKAMGDVIVQDDHSMLIADAVYGGTSYFEKTSPSAPFRATALLHGGGHTSGFGEHMALDGCWAIIGSGASPYYGTDPGAVNVYNRCPSGKWTYTATIYPPDSKPKDLFSYSIALSGNEMLIGAPGANSNSGAVYSYTYNGTQWVYRQRFVQDHGANGLRFGEAVAFQGTLAVVGVPRAPDVGQVQVFKKKSNGNWAYLASVTPGPSDGSWSHFGGGVQVTADRVVIAAAADSNAQERSRTGRLFVYKRTTSGITPELEIASDSPNSPNRFGTAFALSGRHLIVGDPEGLPSESSHPVGRAAIYQLPAP